MSLKAFLKANDFFWLKEHFPRKDFLWRKGTDTFYDVNKQKTCSVRLRKGHQPYNFFFRGCRRNWRHRLHRKNGHDLHKTVESNFSKACPNVGGISRNLHIIHSNHNRWNVCSFYCRLTEETNCFCFLTSTLPIEFNKMVSVVYIANKMENRLVFGGIMWIWQQVTLENSANKISHNIKIFSKFCYKSWQLKLIVFYICWASNNIFDYVFNFATKSLETKKTNTIISDKCFTHFG